MAASLLRTNHKNPIIHMPGQTKNPLDLHKEIKAKNIEVRDGKIITTASSSLDTEIPRGEVLDITAWLPYASKHYKVSNDISDYLIVPVFTIPTGLPNRNGIAFDLKSLVDFCPERGMQYYKTFKGQPVQYEHKNDDITKAKGVIADVYMKKLQGYGGGRVYKILELLCIDRTKDPDLARRVLDKDINSYSMGAYVGESLCSYCGKPVGKCPHINPKQAVVFYEKDGHIVHRIMRKVIGFETSIVASPAWTTATSDFVTPISDGNDLRSLMESERNQIEFG